MPGSGKLFRIKPRRVLDQMKLGDGQSFDIEGNAALQQRCRDLLDSRMPHLEVQPVLQEMSASSRQTREGCSNH